MDKFIGDDGEEYLIRSKEGTVYGTASAGWELMATVGGATREFSPPEWERLLAERPEYRPER